MQDNKNDKDFSPSDFYNDESEEMKPSSSEEYGESGNASGTDSDTGSRRTEFLRDGADYSSFDGGASAYQSFGDFRRWDSFSLDDEKQAKAKFSKFFLGAFIYLLVANLIMIGIQLFIMLTQSPEVAESLLTSPTVLLTLNAIALYAIGLPILYLIIRKMRFVPRLKSKLSVKELFVFILIGEALMYIGSLVGSTIMSYFDAMLGAENSNETIDMVVSAPIWLVIIVACVLGPIVEELIFRKFLMDRLGAYGDRMIIFVSAISFALLHGNLHQFFYAFTLGLLLAFIYAKTGRVVYTIIIHAVINFLGSAVPILVMPHIDKLYEMLPLMEEAMENGTSDAFTQLLADNIGSLIITGLYSMLISGLAIAGIVLLVIRLKRKQFFVSDRCEVFIPKQRRGAVIFLNVGVMLFLVFTSITIIYDLIAPIFTSVSGAGV